MLQLSIFHFICPKIESKNYPWKKPNTLNYPNSIQEILAMCGKKQSPTSIHERNQTPWTICEKNQTPWTIWIILWILQKHRIFLSLFYFSKNLAMFSFVLLSRLKANHWWMYKKMNVQKNFYVHKVSEKIWLCPLNIQIESDSSRFFFHGFYLDSWTTWTGYKSLFSWYLVNLES